MKRSSAGVNYTESTQKVLPVTELRGWASLLPQIKGLIWEHFAEDNAAVISIISAISSESHPGAAGDSSRSFASNIWI